MAHCWHLDGVIRSIVGRKNSCRVPRDHADSAVPNAWSETFWFWIVAGILKIEACLALAGLLQKLQDELKSIMLSWTLIFFLLALIMAALGVSDLGEVAVGIAQTLFTLFSGLMIASLLVNESRRWQL